MICKNVGDCQPPTFTYHRYRSVTALNIRHSYQFYSLLYLHLK
jgi:hypothetical protein